MNTHKIGVEGNGSLFLASVYMSGKFRVTRSLDGESTGSRHSFRQGTCYSLCRGVAVILSDGNLDKYTRLVPGDLNSEWKQRRQQSPYSEWHVRYSVSMHGNLLVIGGKKSGSNEAIVYGASADEDWQASSQPLHKPSSSGDSWANIVRLHGETVVVSEREYISDGRVCVYNYSSATDAWGLDECLEPDRTLFDESMANAGTFNFGQSIDIDGGTIVVGGTSTCDNRGSAWVFERRKDSVAGVKWVQTSKLFAADTARDR